MKTIIVLLLLCSVQLVAIGQRRNPVRNPTAKQIAKDSTTRLLKLTPLDPNRTSRAKLITQFKLTAAVADALIKGRPYRLPLDVYKSPALSTIASFREVAIIMAGARATLHFGPTPPARKRQIFGQSSGLIFGSITDALGDQRYFISDSLGNEIISASKGGTDSTRIDVHTIKILGSYPWDLHHMLLKQRLVIYDILKGPVGKNAIKLWQKMEPQEQDESRLIPISSLSQVLLMAYQFSMENCNESNGCTSGPDFNFKSCCDEHDKCYCRGGGADAQEKCDQALRTCISSKGSAILGNLYEYLASTFGGSAHFGPTIENDSSGPDNEITGPSSGPTNCRVIVRLISVEYGGDYIGNDWTYSVAVNGASTRILHNERHNHHATRSYDRVISDKVVSGACGNTQTLVISANAREEDSMDDDKGSATVLKSVSCTAGTVKTYDKLLTVSVKEAINFFPDDHGKMYFLFRITTQCQ